MNTLLALKMMKKFKSLCMMLPQMSRRVRRFDEIKCMSLLIKYDEI